MNRAFDPREPITPSAADTVLAWESVRRLAMPFVSSRAI